MNLLQRTPFFRLLLPLMSGILLYQYIRIPSFWLMVLMGVSFVLISFTFIVRKPELQYRFRWIFGLGTMIFLIAIGYTICRLFDQKNQFTELNHRAIYEVELISAPVEKERSHSFRVKLLQRYDSLPTAKVNGKAIIYLQKDSMPPNLLMGDRLMIEAEFKSPDGVQNPMGFDYSAYLKRQGIGATTYLTSDKWKKTGQNKSFLIKRFANQCRNYLLEIYKKYKITGTEFGVLAALTLGYTDSLEADVYKLYSHTGAVHILSVSGLHVAIVYGAIYFLLGFLKNNTRQMMLRSFISILFIWVYAIITGLSPAVLRASVMLTIVSAATFAKRKPQIYNTVIASAFLLLLISPNLLFDIGFQLSYSAVLSIVAFQKSISRLYTPLSKPVKWMWNLTAVSLAAQLGTAPIAIYYFSQFPNYFLLTNYAAIPLSTGIIYLSILLLFVSFVPIIASGVAFVLKWSIWSMNYSLGVIAGFPGSVSVISITSVQLAMLVAVILVLTVFAFNKKFSTLAVGLGLILIFSVNQAFRQYESLNRAQLIVFSDSRNPVINFIDGKNNYIYTLDEKRAVNTANAYWRASLINNPQQVELSEWFDDGFAYFKRKRILILKDDSFKFKTATNPISVDYLIITNKLKPRMEQLLTCIRPENVIVDKSISMWYTNHVREVCNAQQINFYSVAEKGAYMTDLVR